ncbi:MAG TPA: hypothetical protein VM580_30155 [Labilithrix sp.]|nr:hypothetical protein [Labilithrix sp.]
MSVDLVPARGTTPLGSREVASALLRERAKVAMTQDTMVTDIT